MSKKKSVEKTKLVIFLGAGGVGKTTLSAGYALRLARDGYRVGLLGIDPSKRLQTALGAKSLGDLPQKLKLPEGSKGELSVAILDPEECLQRWVHEVGMQPMREQAVLESPFFRALAERLATAVDSLAAARLAEWREKAPELDVLVVDTAPGLHALDFLSKPKRIMDFFDSSAVDWLRWVASEDDVGFLRRAVRLGARKTLDGLSVLGGKTFLLAFADFTVLLEEFFAVMNSRLRRAEEWMRHSQTRYYVVSTVREEAVETGCELARCLRRMQILPHAALINRTIAPELQSDAGFVEFLRGKPNCSSLDEDDCNRLRAFSGYVESWLSKQQAAIASLKREVKEVREIPATPAFGTKNSFRLQELALLWERVGEL